MIENQIAEAMQRGELPKIVCPYSPDQKASRKAWQRGAMDALKAAQQSKEGAGNGIGQ